MRISDCHFVGFFFFKQKTAYEIRISDWSSDVCSSDLSLHAYFLRGGDEDHPIDFRVEADMDGGSFSNRRVIASQNDKPLLNLVASFQRIEEGLHHQAAMPQIPLPEDLPDQIGSASCRERVFQYG